MIAMLWKKHLFLILLFFFLLGCILWMAFFFLPKESSHILQKRNSLEELIVKNDELFSKIKEVHTLEKKAREVQEGEHLFHVVVENEDDLVVLIKEIEDVAQESGVSLSLEPDVSSQNSPQKIKVALFEEKGSDVQPLLFSASLRGDYYQILSFLQGIENASFPPFIASLLLQYEEGELKQQEASSYLLQQPSYSDQPQENGEGKKDAQENQVFLRAKMTLVFAQRKAHEEKEKRHEDRMEKGEKKSE